MMQKLLTVVVPSYNMEKYLPKCLGSLIVDDERLFSMLDIIVVNDGSKDRTSEIAHEFATRYPDVVRVIDKPNGHYGSCVNAALGVACGDYVRILDPDDWFGKEEFREFLTWLQAVEVVDADLLLTDYELIDESDRTLESVKQPFPDGWVDARRFFELASDKYYPALPGLTYRRSLLSAISYRQTEGVPYTDAEWIVYPMVGVRKIACRHLCVYKYFRGRNDQTMSVESMERRWRVIDTKVMQKIVEESDRFHGLGSEDFRKYFRHSIKEILTPIYEYGFLRGREVRFAGGAVGFDQYMRRNSQVATHVMESLLLPFLYGGRYLIRIPYVKLMHEGRSIMARMFMSLWRVYALSVKMRGLLWARKS